MKALLLYTYIDKSTSKSITTILENNELYYIDECTKSFESINKLLDSFFYQDKVKGNKNGKLELLCILNNSKRIKLPLLINDNNRIVMSDDYIEGITSDIEKARKLLFNSKNKKFLRMFLNNEIFASTTYFDMSINNNEYDLLKRNNINVISKNGQYFVNANDIFKIVLELDKLGPFRKIYEDCLEKWKYNTGLSCNDSDIVYYNCRNLRTLSNYYYKTIKNEKKVTNLKIYKDLARVVCYNDSNRMAVEVVKDEKFTSKTMKLVGRS